MAGKLFNLIKKNYKLLIRTRSSALIVIFGPLLLILLVGLAFNTAGIYSIRVASFSEKYSTLADALLGQLQKNQFTVAKVETKEACVNGVKTSAYNVCAVFPADLDQTKSGEIVFYVDNTKTNLVYAITDAMSAAVATKSKELTTQMIQAVIDVMATVQTELIDKKELVAALQTSNEQIDKNLDEAMAKLKAMHLSFDTSTLPLSTLKDLVKPQGNQTSQASIVLARLESELNIVENQIDTANNAKEKSLIELNAAKPLITSNLGYTTSLSAALIGIEKSIDGAKQVGIGKIASPLSTRIEPVIPQKTSLSYIFPTLLVLIIMFVSMLIASALEIRERSSKIFFKNFITPTSNAMFLFANFVTNLSIVMLQLIVLIAAAFIFFNSQLLPALALLSLALIIIASLFLLLGMLLGSLFRSEETSTIAAISISFILLFFSGTILPLETLPEFMRNLAYLNPFYLSESLLNKIILFNAPLSTVASSMYALLGTVSVLFVIVFFAKKLSQKTI